MERKWLGFMGFRTFLIVGSIAFPMLVTFTLLQQNSIFDIGERFFKIDVIGGRAKNATINVLKGGAQNVTAQARGEVQNAITHVLEKEAQNVTAEDKSGAGQNIKGSEVELVPKENIQDGIPGIVEDTPQRNTTSDAGPKNYSLVDVENDSSLSTSIGNVKLLDGLLASTFDEGSCLSRYQSYLYRKTSPYKPSPYLKSKLRNYEHLHRNCGPHTKSYHRTMGTGNRSSKKKAASKCKYLVWIASNGLGNRMLTLSSAFLYAILTDRILLVRFGTDMVGLFCEPFPDSSWLLPKDFPYWKNWKNVETYENLRKNDMTNTSKGFLPSFLLVNLQHSHDGHENHFQCDNSQDLLQKVAVLILTSDQYFAPSLFMIPSFKQELSKMFPEKDTVFHHLGRYLFHPSNEAWGLISRYYEAHLAKANQRVGLQIRVYNTHRTPHQTVLGEILACARKHRLLPELDMQNSVISPAKNQTLKAVLVASLFSEYGEGLRTLYMTKQTVTGELIKVYQPSHEERQRSNDNMHNIKAWTEVYLLSLCDALITSRKSTFGYVAQSLGGLKPWILQKTYGETIPNPPCQRLISMEPCFHYPPKHDCMGNGIVNITSLFPYIRDCEDVNSGIKLVNHNH